MAVDLRFWRTADPDDLFRAVASEENREFVVRTMGRLTLDPVWTDWIVKRVEAGCIETRCFVSWLARELQPDTYLEVGVRRGFSMAMVARRARAVELYGFDSWLRRYAGVSNPGPGFVQSELEKVGYLRKAHFIGGNSHKTLPAFFRGRSPSILGRTVPRGGLPHPPIAFDLITVDGDHSLLGAYRDLLDTMPHCAVGGVVLFDDIAPDLSALDPEAARMEWGEDPCGWGNLLGVWEAIQQRFKNFRYFQYVKEPPGVGLAVRLS